MIKTSQRMLIWKDVLGKLEIEKERISLRPKIVDAYLTMLWEEILTPTEKELFKENPQSVYLTKHTVENSGFLYAYSFLFHNNSISHLQKESLCERGNLPYSVYSDWSDFCTDLIESHPYFSKFELMVDEYHCGKFIKVPKEKIWIPRVKLCYNRDDKQEGTGERDGESYVTRCVSDSYSYHVYYRDSESRLSEKLYIKDHPQIKKFTSLIVKYADLARKVYRTINNIDEFLSMDPVNITFLRNNFPELIEGIKF